MIGQSPKKPQKSRWTRTHKIAIASIIIPSVLTVVGFLISAELRKLHPTEAAKPQPEIREPINAEPAKATKPQTETPKHKAKVEHKSSSNDSSTTQPIAPAIAPNGIAITGGNVTNPTVNNNFGPPPHKPAVVTVCIGESKISNESGHQGQFKMILTLTTDSPVENPTYGFQFSGELVKGSSASSPEIALNIREGSATPTSFAFTLYQTWYPGPRVNVVIYSEHSVTLTGVLGKHSESFVPQTGCNSGL
jgi:hypothetical protein